MVIKTDTMLYVKSHRKWYVVGFVLSLALFAWATYTASSHVITGWEANWFTRVNNWPGSWETFWAVVTLGGSVWASVAGVAGTFFLRMYRLCWRLAVSVFAVYGITYLVKHLVARARPEVLLDGVHVRAVEAGMGFTSSHAAIAAVISLTILPYLPRKWAWLPPLCITLVALSRLYLGVHVPLDLVGGVCVGVAVVSLIRITPQPVRVLLRLD